MRDYMQGRERAEACTEQVPYTRTRNQSKFVRKRVLRLRIISYLLRQYVEDLGLGDWSFCSF